MYIAIKPFFRKVKNFKFFHLLQNMQGEGVDFWNLLYILTIFHTHINSIFEFQYEISLIKRKLYSSLAQTNDILLII